MTPPASERAIVRLDEVDSTQTAAFALAEEGAPDGTVVVADYQRAGRGRRGHRWDVERGTGVLVSIVLRPTLPTARWPLLSLATAVAVAETLRRVAGLAPRLTWPNDVLVGGRKIAGILLETRGAESGGAVVVGVGINVNQRRFPPQLAERATSIALALGREADREAVLVALLDELDAWRRRLETEGFEPVRRRWLDLADTIGRRVTADDASGVAIDLDHDGALLVRDGRTIHRVRAGELHAAGR